MRQEEAEADDEAAQDVALIDDLQSAWGDDAVDGPQHHGGDKETQGDEQIGLDGTRSEFGHHERTPPYDGYQQEGEPG